MVGPPGEVRDFGKGSQSGGHSCKYWGSAWEVMFNNLRCLRAARREHMTDHTLSEGFGKEC